MATLPKRRGKTSHLPDHTQLPCKDGIPARSSFEAPQFSLLSSALAPFLLQWHSNGDYFIGQDCGIYWEKTGPPALGCKAPDWYLVLDVPRLLDGQIRRSYVLWQEMVTPLLILEYASDAGAEERDATPMRGKFWVYERRIRPPYYGIYLPDQNAIEMHHLVEDRSHGLDEFWTVVRHDALSSFAPTEISMTPRRLRSSPRERRPTGFPFCAE